MYYTIGELAKVVNLSTDAIRYYEEMGLLTPHYVDPVNRYRYYTPEQIGTVTEIMEWKECGLTLEEIGEMLGGADADRRQRIFQERLADVLDRQGWMVADSVPDGEQGLERYGRHKPNVVVLDIGLEGMDGIQVLKRIRQLDAHAKVVMCSARGTPEVVQECLDCGAAAFVAKPFLPHVLADAVAAALQPQTLG